MAGSPGEPTAGGGGDLARFGIRPIMRAGGANARPIEVAAQPATESTPLWRIRHSPAAGGAAMVLFLVVSALWLVAAGTAQARTIVQPCARPACPQPPSYTSLHVWLLLGIAGAVLTLASFVLVVRRAVGERRTVGTARLVRRAAATGFAGAVAEVIVVLLLTHVAIVTAPLGFENSGEAGAAIGILGVAQPALAGALALVWGRLLRVSPGGPRPGAHRIRPWRAILGLGGMVLSCAAVAAWSLRDETIGLLVNTRLIAGTASITNAGAWWPGLFAAMLALTLVAAACAPGMTSTADGTIPRVPPAGDRTASPASAP
jgi:hypothetical protein